MSTDANPVASAFEQAAAAPMTTPDFPVAKTANLRVVVVFWRDTSERSEQLPLDDLDGEIGLLDRLDVGYIAAEDEHSLTIAGSFVGQPGLACDDGDRFITIPKAVIQMVVLLGQIVLEDDGEQPEAPPCDASVHGVNLNGDQH